MPQVQTTIPSEVLADLKVRAEREGTSLSALISRLVSHSQGAEGFIGATVRYAGDTPEHGEGRWIPVALDGRARIVDGSLVVESGGGDLLHAIAPGYWREASRRVERDRPLFNGGASLLD